MQVAAPELTARTMGSGRRNADAGKQPKALGAHLGRAVERHPSGGQPTSNLHCCEPGVGHKRVLGIFRFRAPRLVASDHCDVLAEVAAGAIIGLRLQYVGSCAPGLERLLPPCPSTILLLSQLAVDKPAVPGVCAAAALSRQSLYQTISMATAMHIPALQAQTTETRLGRRPSFSYSHAAVVRLAPNHVSQVHSECWLESPL